MWRTRLRPAAVAALISWSAATPADIAFQDVTAKAGPFHTGESWGASWGDLNGDLYPDLYVSNHKQRDSLYRNIGGVRFKDVIAAVDVDRVLLSDPTGDTHGAAWGDFDNDGDQDLMALTGGNFSRDRLLENIGGKLADATSTMHVPFVASGRMATWLDYNNDGRLDLLLSSRGGGTKLMQQTGSGFADRTALAAGGASVPFCKNSGYGMLADVKLTRDRVDDGRMELLCAWQMRFPENAYAIPPSLYPFTDVATSVFPGVFRNKDSAIADFNGDLRPDILVVTGGMRPSDAGQVGTSPRVEAFFQNPGQQTLVFRSTGSVTFDLDSSNLNLSDIRIGRGGVNPSSTPFTLNPGDRSVRGIAAHVPTRDKGLYIGYAPATGTWRVEHSAGGKSLDTYLWARSSRPVSAVRIEGLVKGRDDAQRLNLLTSVPGSKPAAYRESAVGAGLGRNLDCVSAAAGDFDNDRDVDFYLVCRTGVRNLANRLFRNRAEEGPAFAGKFAEVPGAGGAAGVQGFNLANTAGTGDSVVTADYNLDGFLDLFVTNGLQMHPQGKGGPDQLFRNRGNANRWIMLDLQGTVSNREGIGARVLATAGGVTQLRARDGSYHRWSQHHQRLHFGLGRSRRVTLHVDWPSGNVDDFANVPSNRIYRIVEGTTSGKGRIMAL